jgi:hypothetical protein
MSTSLGRDGGYLLVDHTNSPGIPDDLARKWAAQGVVVKPGSTKLEAASYTCAHCQFIVIKNKNRTRPREVCRKCMAVVCDRASCVLECQPFEMLVEKVASGKALAVDPTTNLILPVGAR